MNHQDTSLFPPVAQPVDSHDLLKKTAAARWRMWSIWGSLFFAICLVLSLLFIPQTYTSNLSLAILQPADTSMALLSSAAGLGSSPTAKYIGVLHSRRFAEQVEDRVHLQRLYNMPSREDAIEAILSGLSVKDGSKDGLIYLSLTLYGPSYLAPGADKRRNLVNDTAAAGVNAYVDILRDYMATSDVDRDSILLQGAKEEIRKVRADYDDAVTHLVGLVRSRGVHIEDLAQGAGMSSSSTAETGPGAAGMAKGLEGLYSARGTLETDIQAAEAAMRRTDTLQSDQLNHLNGLPSEDPLLMQARALVDSARADFEATRLQFGPDNPRVVIAQDRVRIAEKTLRTQREAIQKGRTSFQIETQAKLEGLKARQNSVLHQITAAEAKAKSGSEFMTSYERLRNEVILRLEILKAASAHSATLSLQTIAAGKKLSVIDYGIPTRRPAPGVLLTALLNLFLTAFGLAGWIMTDYSVAVREAKRKAEQQTEAAGADAGYKKLLIRTHQ